MNVTRLKLSSLLFAVLWTVFMIVWSGDFAIVNIVVMTLAGAIGGVLWFFAMRWYFRRVGLLPRS